MKHCKKMGNNKKIHFFCPKTLQFSKKALTLHSLNEKAFSTNGTGEVGEWLKPAVC